MGHEISAIAASNGVAIARAFVLKNPELKIENEQTDAPDRETDRLDQALQQAIGELESIKSRTAAEIGEDKAEIFAAHLLVLQDPEMIDQIKEKIQNDNLTAENAVNQVTGSFIEIFENLENEYMKERAADIRDVSRRVLAHLLGLEFTSPAAITEEAIVVTDDLTPSDTAQLNRKYVKGFVTDVGGRTSHSAIMARSMEIPAVVGTGEATQRVENGKTVIIDGSEGKVIVEPTAEEIAKYRDKQKALEAQHQQLKKLVNETTVTKDGKNVELAANIGSPDDLKGVLANGAEGIGLYRTEFLYMGRDNLPNEDEQYHAYKTVLEKMEDHPVTIRTLDIGGDKELPYLQLPEELNPFLGVRAIRLCLEHEDMFRTQLRALLRASIHGRLNIMFPMIATIDEFKQAKALLLEEKHALQEQGVQVADEIGIGMMVEIPAAAVMAPQFAKEVDFFSIGTNDLIQYTMAADRLNEKVSYLYQPFSPAVLNLIQNVISAAHEQGKWVGMCGEMAGDERAVPILLGMGLDEFSMSASSVLNTRALLKNINFKDVTKLAQDVLGMNNSNEVLKHAKVHVESH